MPSAVLRTSAVPILTLALAWAPARAATAAKRDMGRAAAAGDSATRLCAAALPPQGEQEGGQPEAQPREGLYKVINFLILFGALGFVLRKPAAQFFHDRSETIRKGLDEGRKALAASEQRLSAIEAKLKYLDAEIDAFKKAALEEMQAERERLRKLAAEDAERALTFVRLQIESAARAARLELKRFTAQQAIELAEPLIRARLDDTGRQRLVSHFIEGLGRTQGPN